MAEERSCPYCAEEIGPTARRCELCGEQLEPPARGRATASAGDILLPFLAGSVLVALLCVVAGIVAAVAGPGVLRLRKSANEQAAIEALRTIAASQERYHAEDPDGNGAHDYAALGRLASALQLAPDLSSGLRRGYRFEVAPSETAPTEWWMATASPIAPARTGDRYFAVNHTGAIYYRPGQPIPLDLGRCDMPPGAVPLGGVPEE